MAAVHKSDAAGPPESPLRDADRVAHQDDSPASSNAWTATPPTSGTERSRPARGGSVQWVEYTHPEGHDHYLRVMVEPFR